MFPELLLINERPLAFSRLTTADLWTDPHISEQMLRFHLDGSVAISSQTTEFIDAAVLWIGEAFHIGPRSRILDLGCGPGLYVNRLAAKGGDVTGIDFSARSIAYARESAEREALPVTYVNADYLAWESRREYDLIMMIMRDYCALAPHQRQTLLQKVESMLAPEGAFLFDVDSMNALEPETESASYQPSPGGGFWSPNPYFEFINRFVYPQDAVTLDKHVIVEAERTRTICDWIQHFSLETLADELGRANLAIASLLGDVAGRPFDPGSREFAAVARRSAS